MTFLQLQNQLKQTGKSRRGVKNRTDYFSESRFGGWQEAEKAEDFAHEVFKKALKAANEVVNHYFETCRLDKRDKIIVNIQEHK